MYAHLVHWMRSFCQSQYDRFGWMLIVGGHSSGLVNVEMVKLGGTYYHVTCGGEIDQPHTIGGGIRVEAELCDSGAKDTFPSELRIKISEDNFCVIGPTFLSST